jgi:Tol biopolymer transport system component
MSADSVSTVRAERSVVFFLAALATQVALAGGASSQGFAPNPPRTYRLSVAGSGAQGAGFSQTLAWGASCSGTRVAYFSEADNLVPIDGNGFRDVFVSDLLEHSTLAVSVAMGGGSMGNGDSQYASISCDGRQVCFMSVADDLVPNDTNQQFDIFVRDMDTNTTTRVSVASDRTESDGHCSTPSISATGRFVVFESRATNLDNTVTPNGNQLEIYLHDRDADGNGTFDELGGELTRLVSANSARSLLGDRSENPTVSEDGRFIAFEVLNSLNTTDTNTVLDCYVHDRDSDDDGTFDELGAIETFPVSVGPSGIGDGNSGRPFVSADGEWVAFMSEAGNLILPVDTNGDYDCYVCGMPGSSQPGIVRRLSERPGHLEASSPNVQYVSLSPDGRFVVFDTNAPLLSADWNSVRDVYLVDRDWDGNGVYDETGGTSLILASIGHRSQIGNGISWLPGVSSDGTMVSFSSSSTNLVPGDTNGFEDIFVRELRPLRRRL